MVLSPLEDVSGILMISDMMLNLDLKVKFIRFMTWLCVWATNLLSLHIVILYDCITMVQCFVYIHELSMTLTIGLNIKIVFSSWSWDWQDHLCSLTQTYQFWHMVYYRETTYCVHSWGGGDILSKFLTHRFWNGHFIPWSDHLIKTWH